MKKVAKKLLSLVVVVCIAFMGVFTVPTFGAKAENVTDTLTSATTGVTGTSYKDWSGKEGASGAVYKGQSAADASTIQLRSKNSNSGVVTTTSGGKLVKVSVVWNTEKTTAGRILEVYASNTAYSAATDLYGTNKGTKVGTIVYGTSVELAVTGDYTYVGVRSSSGALYLDSLSIEWAPVVAGEPSVAIKGDGSLQVGASATMTAELQNIEGTPVWGSSNTEVATVENGVVTAKAMGTAKITADVNGTTGTKEVTVWPSNVAEITIAEAIEICNFAGADNNTPYKYTATGVITKIDTAYNATYGNISVTISDGTGSILAFRLKGGQNLKVGTKITVTGALVNYKGNTPEFAEACTYTAVVPTEELNAVNAYTSLAYTYTQNGETFETSDFRIRFGVDAALTTIEGAPEYGIQVTVGDTVVKYNASTADSWTVENGYAYVVVDLGDIINDMDKLNTVFTVAAYIVVDGTTYVSTATKPHSVATMVAEYYADEETKAAVEHLYNYLNA